MEEVYSCRTSDLQSARAESTSELGRHKWTTASGAMYALTGCHGTHRAILIDLRLGVPQSLFRVSFQIIGPCYLVLLTFSAWRAECGGGGCRRSDLSPCSTGDVKAQKKCQIGRSVCRLSKLAHLHIDSSSWLRCSGAKSWCRRRLRAADPVLLTEVSTYRGYNGPSGHASAFSGLVSGHPLDTSHVAAAKSAFPKRNLRQYVARANFPGWRRHG